MQNLPSVGWVSLTDDGTGFGDVIGAGDAKNQDYSFKWTVFE